MGTVAMWFGTVGFAICLLVVLLAAVRLLRAVFDEDGPVHPLDAVDRLGHLVDDEQRARLIQRMREAR